MANQWLRLWHDMPTDPKWRTIARHAKQPIYLVQAVYLHLMVEASRSVTRGHANVTVEDLASSLDCDDAQVQAVLDAMQGRVLDGMRLTGWEHRQPKREEPTDGESSAKSPAQRKREQREREKAALNSSESHQCHDESRNVTTDKDKEEEKEENTSSRKAGRSASAQLEDLFNRFWVAYPRKIGKDAARSAFAKRKPDEAMLGQMLAAIDAQKQTEQWQRDGGQYIPHPSTWLNQGRFNDEVGALFSGQSNDACGVGRFV